MGKVKIIVKFFVTALPVLLASPLYAQHERGIELLGFHINGKFDVNFEQREFSGNPFEGKPYLTNYHHFIFISTRKKRFFFSAEVIKQYFYEFGADFGTVSLKFGKIFVPFGADPLFHHNYGGLTGFDQKFVPFIWTEHGANVSLKILQKTDFSIINEIYGVNAPKGDPTKLFEMTAPSSPGKFAIGDRLTIGYKSLTMFLSLYWNQYAGKNDSFLSGIDISLPYGFIDHPVLKNISFLAGFVRMDVEGDPQKIGKYFNFADYLRIGIMLPWNLEFRFITGTQTYQNYEGLVYDKSTADQKDSTAFNTALIYRRNGFLTQLQYVIRMEGKNEVKDDFVRVMIRFEF